MIDSLDPENHLADQLLVAWARDICETPVIAWTVEGLRSIAQMGSVGPAVLTGDASAHRRDGSLTRL